MNRPPQLGLLAVLTAGLLVIPYQLRELSGQEVSDRYRVMVVEIQPKDNSDKKFGERLAEELRELISDMDRHQPISDEDLKRGLKDYELDMEDLNCVRALQLAALINAQVVFCGGYSQEGERFRVEAKYISQSGEEFLVEPVVVPRKDGQKQASQHFYQALQVQSDQATSSLFCAQYASSQQWDDAIEQCDRSIALNPNAVNSRFTRAQVLKSMERLEESLEEFLRVIELDPLNEASFHNAGFIATTLGRTEEGREYYNRYLELNPGNANIRMKMAYELALAGDPLGAMQFIEVGLELDPEDTDLLKQHGGFAFAAGAEAALGAEGLPPDAGDLFRKALVSFTRVYDLEGAGMDVRHLETMVAANIRLGDYQAAVDLSDQVLETHAREPSLWSYYADALRRTGQVDEAIAALDRVVELEPGYANVGARQGKWLLDEGRVEEAIPFLQSATVRGEQTADAASTFVFNNGYQQGIQPENWGYAIKVMRLAKDFEITDDMRQKVDFYLGYAILKDAITRQEPQSNETARATLPLFQEARRLLQGASGYAEKQDMEDDRLGLIGNIDTYIEIQEAIIRRGRSSNSPYPGGGVHKGLPGVGAWHRAWLQEWGETPRPGVATGGVPGGQPIYSN